MNLKYFTGGAGTGKSHTLRELLENETRPHIVCAPTGMAAVNVGYGATTIHKAFCLDLQGHVNNSIFTKPVKKAEVVYIDEASMVSAQLMGSIQEAFELLGIDPEVIAFGDLAQLKPVKADYFFKAEIPDTIERLTKNYRQSKDLEFAEILNRIRVGQVKKGDVDWINDHIEDGSDCLDEYVTLAYSNAAVDYINDKRLKDVQGELRTFEGTLMGDFKEKDCRAPLDLHLKVGAKIIMLNNDQGGQWQNGTTGFIEGFVDAKPNARAMNKEITELTNTEDPSTQSTGRAKVRVKLNTKRELTVDIDVHTWLKEEPTKLTDVNRAKYERWLGDPLITSDPRADVRKWRKILSTGIDYIITGTYTQYPMKLGYASTVHKAQGQTLEHVHILPEGFGMEHGLTYVALSRLTSVSGLSMPRYLNVMDFKFDRQVAPYL
jgi:ATP-dependent DNA helicase PIF1